MKKFLLLCVTAAIFCTSCVNSVPNDRAVYGLYGPVESMEDGAEKIFFTADGSFSPGTYAGLGVEMKTCSYRKVHLVFVNGSEQICEFDKHGRLSKETYIGAEAVYQTEYEYTYDKKSDKVPSYLKATSIGDGESVVTEGAFQCGAVDSLGNWTSMAWNGDVFSRIITYYPEGTAVTENCPMDRSIDWQLVWAALGAILFILVILAWAAHMVYVRFIKKPLVEDYTSEFFREKRSVGGFVSEDEANQRTASLLDGIYNSWTPIESGSDIRVPFSRKDVMNAYAAVAEIEALAPTDEHLVERFNGLNHSLNECMKRSFGGSKTFIIVSLILAIIISLVSGSWPLFGLIAFSSVLYWLASQTPLWMDVKKEIKGKGGKRSFMTRVFGGLFGAAATATTYTVITEYSDGTKTEEEDNSNFWIALICGLVIMLMLAVMMIFVAAINYLRNYVIYR